MGYDIVLLAENEYEDSISLILELSDRDERIEMAIEELMMKKHDIRKLISYVLGKTVVLFSIA